MMDSTQHVHHNPTTSIHCICYVIIKRTCSRLKLNIQQESLT